MSDENITPPKTEEPQAGAENNDSAQQPIVMPKATFSTFILSLASSTMVQLGEMPDPATGKVEENIVLAKHSIDMLSMLQEKTRSNLDADENRLLEGVLYELRMKYVVKK